jgi:RNA polymerase primary sigma factor
LAESLNAVPHPGSSHKWAIRPSIRRTSAKSPETGGAQERILLIMFGPSSSRPEGDHASQRMSPSEERRLVLAAMAGESLARDRLVESFTPLVATIARFYRSTPQVEREELMQAGVLGLLRALERFQPELGTPFWAYASWWVRQAMQQLVSEVARPVVLSDRAVRKLARVREAQREFARSHGREPSSRELAATADMRPTEVEALLVAGRRARGLDEPLSGNRPGGETFGERLLDPRAEDPYDGVPGRVQIEHLPEMLETLNERELRIVSGRFGLAGRAKTLRELAAVLGVSAERVRQIEQVALRKLREAAY